MSEAIQTSESSSAPDADKHEPPAAQSPAVPALAVAHDATPPTDAQATPTTAAANIDLKGLTDRALQFLATASNETLGACLVGLGASTYLVLGRVGLILMGMVGGVVLHASWDSTSGNKAPTIDGRKRETGTEVLRRVLDWRETVLQGKETNADDTDVKLYAGKELDFSGFRPETASAMTELTDAVIRDYVKYWYSPLVPTDDSFPAECRRTLTAFLISMSSHLSRKRTADSFVDFATRSSSFMIIFFQELSAALTAAPHASITDAIDVHTQLKPNTALSSILDKTHQARQFDTAADDILQSYLDPKTYNCRPAQLFFRRILANVVLEKVLEACSKPEWINGWIVYLLEDGEPELMHAIDAGVEGSQSVKNTVEKQAEAAEATGSPEQRNRGRAVSKAQEAMDEAMQEAQRLSRMIAEEDARKLRELETASGANLSDDKSESTTQGIMTPSSSQGDILAASARQQDMTLSRQSSHDSSQVAHSFFDGLPLDPPQREEKKPFTSFDQIIPNTPPTALMANPPPVEKPPPLSLHNCKVVVYDDGPGDKALIRNKPTAEYLIQIEPKTNLYPGWMTLRKYIDFESLHETLRRIATITGSTGFTEAHLALPAWKGHTKTSLCGELERYLNDAVQYKSLAESDKMKAFLERDAQMGRSPGPKSGFPFGQTFENVGKGMFDALTKAPKEVAGSGKALFGGVTGVLGSVATPLGGAKKARTSVSNGSGSTPRASTSSATSTTTPAPIQTRHGRAESTVSELPTHIRTESVMSSFTRRPSTDSIRSTSSPIIDQQPQREAPMIPDSEGKRSGRSSMYGASRSNSRAPSIRDSFDLSPALGGDQILNLPPMPSDMPDDYNTSSPNRASLDLFHSRHPSRGSATSLPLTNANETVPPLPRRPSATSLQLSKTQAQSSPINPTNHAKSKESKDPAAKPKPKEHAPISEQETTVLIDLFFALVQELYTLSSAWGIRMTLLSAAKSFLLRPGNPQLNSIQSLIQSTILDANCSDAAIAAHLRTIRANSMPTEAELAAWPADMTVEEKERLRIKARRLLVERGMPMALSSVMGGVATGEALGRVFDACQVERVARGVVFGVLVQGLRGVVQ